ncbi:MAG: hypothetical protein JWN86_959 [Planctomycetota bacterium]|nr:hypothetical protein [Planctomycetota bacterium]
MKSCVLSMTFFFLASTGAMGGNATITAIMPSRSIHDSCIGDQMNYTAVLDLAGSGHQVVNVIWEERVDGCTPASGFHQWVGGGMSPMITTQELAVGQKTIAR